MIAHELLQPGRKITGMSAILLPMQSSGRIDWDAFESHTQRTLDAGLVPAVNMDTGFGPLLSDADRTQALLTVSRLCAGRRFLAGAQVVDQPWARFDLAGYQRHFAEIEAAGGTPIVFQSYGLSHQDEAVVLEQYRQLASGCTEFYAFELGTMFADFGRIHSLEWFQQLLQIPNCIGAKHSSLSRQLEWQRLVARNKVRPDFQVLTGNDLAIDMVMYGSDYLLGLSTFCPDLFAQRDAYWQQQRPEFHELNDKLQYLGCFAFRHPTSAYKHDAAMFLRQRGWIESDQTYPGSPERPVSDQQVLHEIGRQLGLEMKD